MIPIQTGIDFLVKHFKHLIRHIINTLKKESFINIRFLLWNIKNHPFRDPISNSVTNL